MTSQVNFSELFPSTNQPTRGTNKTTELNQDDFMKLMVTQLENQDPTSPQDNSEFLAQIAQFSTVSGVQDLVTKFDGVSSVLNSNQVLEAASVIGRQVVTNSNVGQLNADETLDATIDVPAAASGVTLYIQDMSGRLVHTRALGPADRGDLTVQWDGTDSQGNTVAPGQYRISAEAVIAGKNGGIPVYTHNQVESVTLGGSGAGVLLNLDSGAQASMSSVKSFL